ncbi:E3 ubiquitin-protein ligase TRIM39 isoform X3 [Haplochromis burtoni]|uniref:E3 ubiquitin-protein ligase TRIM39 isoform X3 n=1 Tax=Haplochromis burtoni TaxID=8153 RepID=UPI001C2D0906|nr:E3 ubiquitin-protein ligase TRIM39 isoform X3 [Haplochromis burtoni]
MSLQVCHCGWSKTTSYQGLRVHQGKMGCTPKGMRIPEHEQFSYLPTVTILSPQIKLTDPFMDIFKNSVKSDSNASYYSWPRITVDQDLGDLQGGMRSTQNQLEENKVQLWRNHQEESHQKCSRPIFSPSVKEEQNMFLPSSFIPQIDSPARQASAVEIIKSLVETQQQSVPTGSNMGAYQGLDLGSGAQSVFMSVSQTFSNHSDHTDNTTTKMETDTFFETPQRSHQSTVSSDKARRALDFSTGGQQVVQLLELPGKAAQHAAICPEEKEKEIDRLKEKKTKKLQKAKQEKMKSDLQQKIHIRELKMAEVRSSEIDCKGTLDAEWLEVNHFFSEAIRVVEDARKKALKPLEERRQKVKGDAQDIIQKLQREIDVLKKAIAEAPKNPDLEVSPLTGLNESTDWKNVQVDTSLSFGTLRTTTSAMMKQIHDELEKLSSIELRRITKFAVDVKLDPTTAHQSLEISDNGKKVRDGGKMSKDPDSPQRFNMFGSILGLNRLSSGRAYWEVEVSKKTGWDLGVARRDANRKGTLSISPDNGYWATVHYEDQKYAALATPPVSLSVKEKPRKVGVFVDYEEGLVSFYDVTSQSHIYSFTECSFGGEILPYFSPHLKQNEKNSDPLIITAVQKQ